MKYPDARIMQFARAPALGQVKTRLEPTLGKEGALLLHRRLTTTVYQRCCDLELCDYELWVEGEGERNFFQNLAAAAGTRVFDQSGHDLGERMFRALEKALRDKAIALIIGSDCPAIERSYLEEALALLAAGADAVLGPAEDGGYVLIGASRVSPDVFRDIPWGSSEVYRQTVQRLDGLHYQWHALPVLWDVDREEDIERFEALLPGD